MLEKKDHLKQQLVIICTSSLVTIQLNFECESKLNDPSLIHMKTYLGKQIRAEISISLNIRKSHLEIKIILGA
jgi:hypothetical protein